MQAGCSNFIQGVRVNELYVLQLPADLQQKVRTYVSSKRRQSDGNSGNNTVGKPEPKIIKVPIPTFPPTAMVYSINKVPADKNEESDEKSSSSKPPVDIVSAAIMAKVLEERERERLNTKHCDTCTCPRQGLVDCSTQATPVTDQSILCVRCAASVRCDSGVVDTSNRASQGLVRYVDVVATRNGEVANRNITSGGNQKSDSIFLLGTASNDQTPCVNISENTAKGLKQEICDESQNRDSDSKMPSSSRRSESNKNSKSSNKNSESCRQIDSTCTKGIINKETTLVSKNGKSFVRSVELPKSNSDISKQDAEGMERDCCQIPSTDGAELPSNRGTREIYGNGTCHLNRVSKFHIRGSETYPVRMKNQEGRTYLSDVANVENKSVSDAAWAKHSSEKPTVGAASKTILNKPKNAETVVGPRHCSLRLQAGSSNILLDNATSYAPVLYTSRHNGGGGDVSSTVLVHTPRSRSASASSTDEAHHRGDGKSSSCVHSPTETEL
ncbi:hypothetical protein B7P43_G16014 [Cryptotermes secundus]|uniref:Uncharacterized protein n=1 Tax=Cryptotermes secundus TaxID=105785 RepID=A0A2J7R999_9NEOP|nr:hypothetical protein B7P43_G16014 [Cryptotermes secundus]